MTKRKPGVSYKVRVPGNHAAQLEQWAAARNWDAAQVAALLLCLAVEQFGETGKLWGAADRPDRVDLKDWLARRMAGGLYGGGTNADDGIPF